MLLINNTPHIEVCDLIACGFTRQAIDKYTSIGSKTLPFIKERGQKLFPFTDKLGERYREAILKRYGNPVDYLAKEPIKALVVKDLAAEAYFLGLVKKGLYTFSATWIAEQTTAASWLNMLVKMQEKGALKKFLSGMDMADFYKSVGELIKADKIDLPASYKRLTEKIKEYQAKSYEIFIHGSTGKVSNAAKVNDEASSAELLSLIENPLQYDDVMVCFLYNKWADENGYKQIEPATVGVWRRKTDYETRMGRHGNAAFNERYTRQVKGFAPSAPGYLWESDDNNLDFYFTDAEATAGSRHYQRYVSYIVADSHNGLILGKSYRQAQSPVIEMVRLAYIDAMYYVRSLTGSWHLPFEVKADHWQNANLFPFYKSIGNFVKPAVGNKHRGYIEQLFGSPHFKRCQKLGAVNYNGNNVTARNTGVNMEAVKFMEKYRPQVGEEAETQIEQFFNRCRKMPAFTRENMEADSKEAQWLTAWQKLSNEQKRPITDEQFLMLFGIRHQPQGRQITITNRGIEPQISGYKFSYDLPSYVQQMPLIGEKVNVIYDPYDMSRVLITNDNDIRFIAKSATLQPRALQDTYMHSRTALNMILSEKKQQVEKVAALSGGRQVLTENFTDVEAVMLGEYMPKELKNHAEQYYLENQNTGTYNAFDQM